MISKEICAKIWRAYAEIEKAEKLAEELKKELKKGKDVDIDENWGGGKGMQLSFPSFTGDASWSLYHVPPSLAVQIIEAHIKRHQDLLVEYNALAVLETRSPIQKNHDEE